MGVKFARDFVFVFPRIRINWFDIACRCPSNSSRRSQSSTEKDAQNETQLNRIAFCYMQFHELAGYIRKQKNIVLIAIEYVSNIAVISEYAPIAVSVTGTDT